jgi:hypothetical protein
MRQHDSHISARLDYLIRCIYEALGIVEGACDFTAWYACGDELI